MIAAERLGLELDHLIADDDEPAIAAITVAELGAGVELATGKRKTSRGEFLDDIVATLPIIAYDLEIARSHTILLVTTRKTGTLRGAHELIIAATALATGRTVVTSDRAGFVDLPGVKVRFPQ